MIHISWNNLRCINISIKNCINIPKRSVYIIELVNGSFAWNKYTWFVKSKCINIGHYTTRTINRYIALIKAFIISTIFDS